MTMTVKICAQHLHESKKRVLVQTHTHGKVTANKFIKPGEHSDVLLYEGQTISCREVDEDYESKIAITEADALADLNGEPRPDNPTVNS
ncbi:hypothetical protein [Cellvibrio sp. QJXJ]|uniref:hypothetical protein n=1 Tax=Cellvibrio sp. QJXJ TaxID=2964606 RepID=UPI0021C4927B|nr:hypothetical protein [Cellvibrio sp. QJXJ]UUA73100.1 hypothetical protein NNX04_01305 [Cellvibrio sp. QJXJ]